MKGKYKEVKDDKSMIWVPTKWGFMKFKKSEVDDYKKERE